MVPLKVSLARLGVKDPGSWEAALLPALIENDIDTRLRRSGFLANTLYETTNYTQLTESLDYSPSRLREVFPTHFTRLQAQTFGRIGAAPADQKSIAELAYGGRLGNGPIGSGDGWRFRGQGLLHLSGRFNMERFAARIGITVEALLIMVVTKEGAAMSAAHYWRVTGCNEVMDHGDIRASRALVQGGQRGLAEVTSLYLRCLDVLDDSVTEPSRAPVRLPPSHAAARLNLIELDRIERARTEELNEAELKRIQAHG